jgi:cytochrome c-type biogenesis protein CcmF
VLWAWTRGGSSFGAARDRARHLRIAGALSDLAERTGLFRRVPFAHRGRRARGLPRSTWGTVFAHAGHRRRPDRYRLRDHLNNEYIGSMKPNDVARLAGCN